MCNFCSAVTKGNGKLFYFDWEERQELLKSNPKEYNPDSYDSIAHYFNLDADKVNKYEYNPLTKEFKFVDQINIKDDRALAKKNFENLDWEKIVKPLIIKPIINALTDVRKHKVTRKDITDLKEWAAVRESVGDFLWTSVGSSIGASVSDFIWSFVGDSVRASVMTSVWTSVGNSVWASVWNSVRASVRASVGNSVWASVWAYISTFFNIKYKYDFSPTIRLWERGFVPSFDGKTWRLHQGKNAKVVYTMLEA